MTQRALGASVNSTVPNDQGEAGSGGGQSAPEVQQTGAAQPVSSSGEKEKLNPPQQPVGHLFGCISLKAFSLVSLVVQNCGTVLLMRYSLTGKNRKHYSVASVVITQEAVKFVLCFLAVVKKAVGDREASAANGGIVHAVSSEIITKDAWKLLVPAGCFTLQNNLLFVALANLEATLFQVTYQLKLLATAVLMVLMLGKSLSYLKWASLFVLFIGIVLTQLKPGGGGGSKKSGGSAEDQSTFLGLTAVVICALSSAFASVYFEKVLKNQSSSLPVRNIQLSFFSSGLAMGIFLFLEQRTLDQFFFGYDALVWIMVMFQAAGGLLVALVIKYADNILKGFATAIAIVLSGVLSYFFIDFEPSAMFMAGGSLVLTAVCLYAYFP